MISQLPTHVAIVPDGNRRWAKKRNLKPWEGHKQGAQMIENIAKEGLNLKIKYLTFWGSSEDNLRKRPLQERKALLEIYEQYFKKLIQNDDVYKNEVQINIIGKWAEQFPKKLISILKDGIERTKNHSNYFLNFLLAYNGNNDMLSAVKKVAQSFYQRGNFEDISSESIRSNLMTSRLPDVDLLIRTGVEDDPHNSAGFMLWQTQNSQYYFSNKMLPDFGANEFREAIESYSQREIRLGG